MVFQKLDDDGTGEGGPTMMANIGVLGDDDGFVRTGSRVQISEGSAFLQEDIKKDVLVLFWLKMFDNYLVHIGLELLLHQ